MILPQMNADGADFVICAIGVHLRPKK